MLLHHFRFKEKEKRNSKEESKRDFSYLKDEKEIDILESMYSKVFIEKNGFIFTFGLIIFLYYKSLTYFESIRSESLYEDIFIGLIVLIGIGVIMSIIMLGFRWWKCRKKIKECGVSKSYLRWVLFKRGFKVIAISLYLYSVLALVGELRGMIAMDSIIGFKVTFIAASVIAIVGLLFSLMINSIRGKFLAVGFQNMAEGLKKGQLDIAKESLKADGEMRMLWGEGYVIVNKQIEILIEKIEKAAKEEELSLIDRTELITNASHDIRTPLTSILNYIDILKNEDITELEREECIKILKNKTERLRELLLDLKYATDFSIGEVSVKRESINIVELLNKAMVENEDTLKKGELDIIADYKVEESACYVDKNNTMRVFQNLLSNIAKYSLEGSRVYILVEDISYNSKCKITFKNISKDKLNISPEELMKRFKRGDASRSEAGHGLGLDIVKNLMKLQYGEIKVDIQGDLFKVELIFDK